MSSPKRFNAVALIGLVVVVAILALLAALPNAFAQSKAVLKNYPCPADRIDAAVEQIRTAFKNVAELRVSADRRNSQILVIAPADVQDQIAARMNQIAAQAAPAARAVPAAVPQAPAADASALTATNIPLRNTTAREFEAKLLDILKNRLAALPNLMPGTNRYQLAAAGRSGVELAVDLTTNQVTLRGPAQGVLAAGRLVHAMDTSAKAASEDIRLIPFQAAKPDNMKKAVDAVRLAGNGRGNGTPMVASLFAGQTVETEVKPSAPAAAETKPSAVPQKAAVKDEAEKPKLEVPKEGENPGLSGEVKVEMLEGLDVIVLAEKRKTSSRPRRSSSKSKNSAS